MKNPETCVWRILCWFLLNLSFIKLEACTLRSHTAGTKRWKVLYNQLCYTKWYGVHYCSMVRHACVDRACMPFTIKSLYGWNREFHWRQILLYCSSRKVAVFVNCKFWQWIYTLEKNEWWGHVDQIPTLILVDCALCLNFGFDLSEIIFCYQRQIKLT